MGAIIIIALVLLALGVISMKSILIVAGVIVGGMLIIVFLSMLVDSFLSDSDSAESSKGYINTGKATITYEKNNKPPNLREVPQDMFDILEACGSCIHYDADRAVCRRYGCTYTGFGCLAATTCDDFSFKGWN